jgi:peroxiredoxin
MVCEEKNVFLWVMVLLSALAGLSPAVSADAEGQNQYANLSHTHLNIGTSVGQLAPDFILPDLEGREVHLKDFRGKDVFVVFGRTTCPHTVSKMPILNTIYANDPNEQAMKVIFISIGENREKLIEFAANNKIEFDLFLDTNGSVARSYCVRGVPACFIIDETGAILYSANRHGQTIWSQLMPKNSVSENDSNIYISSTPVIAFGLGFVGNVPSVVANPDPEICDYIDNDGYNTPGNLDQWIR